MPQSTFKLSASNSSQCFLPFFGDLAQSTLSRNPPAKLLSLRSVWKQNFGATLDTEQIINTQKTLEHT